MKVAIRVIGSIAGLLVACGIFAYAYLELAIHELNTGNVDINQTTAFVLVAGVLVLGLSLYGLVSSVRIGRQGKTS